MIDKYIYLQRIFSFCETTESKTKIHTFDTTVVRGCGMYEKLTNLYKMKSIVMFRNFIAERGGGGGGGNVMIQKPHLTFHKHTEWMKKWLQRLITDFTCLTFLPLSVLLSH